MDQKRFQKSILCLLTLKTSLDSIKENQKGSENLEENLDTDISNLESDISNLDTNPLDLSAIENHLSDKIEFRNNSTFSKRKFLTDS